MINRREVFIGAALLPIAGCSAFETAAPQWVAALQAVGQEAVLILPQLTAAGLSNNVSGTVSKIIAQIEAAAGAVGATSTAVQGQTTLVAIEGYINSLAPLILPFVSLIPGGAAIGLIVAALPAIELAVNLAVSIISPQAATLAAAAPTAPVTPGADVARVPVSGQAALDLLLRSTGH